MEQAFKLDDYICLECSNPELASFQPIACSECNGDMVPVTRELQARVAYLQLRLFGNPTETR